MTKTRLSNLLIFLVCAVLMGIANYIQYVLYLDPCPLCMVQRVAVMAIGILCLIAFIHNPSGRGRIVYASGLGVFSLFGAAIAARHVWLQNLPADKVPECLPGIEFILANNPLFKAIGIILEGTGECAETMWTFLGISIPGWTLIAFLAFTITAIVQMVKARKPD